MFGISLSSFLILYLINVVVIYITLAGPLPKFLGAKINYRGKGMRLMIMSVLWGPLILFSLACVMVRKNLQNDAMHEELQELKKDKADQ